MLNCLWDEYCIPYLDDILCFAKTFEDHVDWNVSWGYSSAVVSAYVGRLVSGDGAWIDPGGHPAVKREGP